MKKSQVDVENATVVKRDEYVNTLEAIVAGGFCPFCEEHLFKHHRRPITHTGTHWLVTENSWPYEGTQFHFLFIAREHFETTEDLPLSAWIEFQELYSKLVKENGITGGTLVIRSGNTKFTGASVHHLHAHFIVGSPRTESTEPIRALVGFNKK